MFLVPTYSWRAFPCDVVSGKPSPGQAGRIPRTRHWEANGPESAMALVFTKAPPFLTAQSGASYSISLSLNVFLYKMETMTVM